MLKDGLVHFDAPRRIFAAKQHRKEVDGIVGFSHRYTQPDRVSP
jgi:hypothetical protein